MNELVLILIMLATTVYVTQPFWGRLRLAKVNSKSEQLGDLLERRDSLLAAIKEMEFERETGKVSQEDFAEMDAKFRSEAITVLRRIDALNGKNGASRKLEKELQKLRSQRKQGNRFCANCEKPVGARDQFCSHCGHQMRK